MATQRGESPQAARQSALAAESQVTTAWVAESRRMRRAGTSHHSMSMPVKRAWRSR